MDSSFDVTSSMLLEHWGKLNQGMFERAVQTLIFAKGEEQWIMNRRYLLEYPRQLAIHELDRPLVRECRYEELRLYLDYSRILEICEKGK